MSAPATHTQPSRKGKKAWRKNVDLTAVTSGLESTRSELLTGGIIAEKDSADLFTTDLQGDAETARKQASAGKLLKADEILAQRSAIPAIPKRKRKDEVSVFEGSGPGGKKQKNGEYISHKELRRLKMIADGGRVGLEMEGEKASHDPWGEETIPVQDERFSFLEPKKAKVAPKTLGQAPVAITKDGKAVKSVRKPEAGKSYNPNVQDWTVLYEREGAAAVEKEKERLRLEAEAEAREIAAMEEAERVEAQEREQFAADYESAWESEWEGIQSGADEDGNVVHTKKMPKRKTPAERNKIKARKEREQREVWEKKQKIRAEQEKRIKQIAKELSAKDKAKKQQQLVLADPGSDSSSEDDREAEIVKRRFGKVAMPEAPLEVTLPEDLEDTLRRLKPEGNLLTDRYRNLLLNGKVEIRKPVGQRKQKQTYRTEKWSYKDWELK